MPLQFCHEFDNENITFKRMNLKRVVTLKELLGHMNPEEFRHSFSSRDACLQILAYAKWADGYECRNCGNDKFCKGGSPFSRRCTRCKKDESATAHTIFHHCRIELPLAFEMAYKVCGSPAIAALELSRSLETRHMTCLNFKKRILQCLQSDGSIIPADK